MQYTIEKPYRMVTKNAEKNWKFSTFVRFLGPFSDNWCFRKMCVAGMKRGPCPTILYSFFTKLNEEALLKVSLKNLYWFQSCKIMQTLCLPFAIFQMANGQLSMVYITVNVLAPNSKRRLFCSCLGFSMGILLRKYFKALYIFVFEKYLA